MFTGTSGNDSKLDNSPENDWHFPAYSGKYSLRSHSLRQFAFSYSTIYIFLFHSYSISLLIINIVYRSYTGVNPIQNSYCQSLTEDSVNTYLQLQLQMYNQFTELEQKPLPLKKIQLNPLELPRAGKKKKPKLHSKNPYKIKKVRLLGEEAMRQKHLDGFLMLKLLRFEHPKDIIKADISYKRIVSVDSEHLKYFQNLVQLNCSENRIQPQWLTELPALQTLNITHNGVTNLPLEMRNFRHLKSLNVSFNYIQYAYISHLSMIPNLKQLNIGYNELRELPDDMSSFQSLTKLSLAGNQFASSFKASDFWASLATIQSLKELDVSRNKIRGIHTQKLSNGNFANVEILDFSYNAVQNQHNLICARNFKGLKKIVATGNPFAIQGNYKGLEMEIYARTGGQLIIEEANTQYLKNPPKQKIPIKFDRIVKIQTDNFERSRNILFGIDIVREPSREISESDQQDQEEEQMVEPEEESQDEQPMFMTQQPAIQKTKPKTNRAQDSSIPQSAQQSQLGSLDESQHSEMSSGSLGMDQFRRAAAQMIGNSRQYRQAFDINTAYKALKGALGRSSNM